MRFLGEHQAITSLARIQKVRKSIVGNKEKPLTHVNSPVPSLELETSPITNRLPQISSPAFPPAPIPNRSSPNRRHGSASISTSSSTEIVPLLACSEGREGDAPSLLPPLVGGHGILTLVSTLTRTLQFFGMLPEGVDCDSGIHPVFEHGQEQTRFR